MVARGGCKVGVCTLPYNLMGLLEQQHSLRTWTKKVIFIWMLKVIHQFFIINYQGWLLKLMVHVLEHLRAVTLLLLHHAEVLLSQLLRWWWCKMRGLWVVQAHLRMITPVVLLQLLVEVKVVFLQVYYHHRHVISAVVIRASLVSYLLRNLIEGHSLLS